MLSVVVNHCPWRAERVLALAEMDKELRRECPVWVHDYDYRGRPWQAAKVDWALAQWEWASRQSVTHCLFLTDDLHLAPGFGRILRAMISARPAVPIGLLSNHPRGPALAAEGITGYYTNSWLVGPAYVLPRDLLQDFLSWFKRLPDGSHLEVGTKAYHNDDSSLNEWVTNGGGPGRTWHPLPTIVEHRADIDSTVGHGDEFSRERVSWRAVRRVVDDGERWAWESRPWPGDLLAMSDREFWRREHPMLEVGQ